MHWQRESRPRPHRISHLRAQAMQRRPVAKVGTIGLGRRHRVRQARIGDACEPVTRHYVVLVKKRQVPVLEVHAEVVAREQREGCIRGRQEPGHRRPPPQRICERAHHLIGKRRKYVVQGERR